MPTQHLPVWLQAFRHTADELTLTRRNGQDIGITAQDLYENAPSHLDPVSGQRRISSTQGIDTPRISLLGSDNDGLIVTYNYAERHHYSFRFLEEHWLSLPLASDKIQPGKILWSSTQAAELPVFDYDAYLNEDDVLHSALAALVKYGFVRLADAPLHANEVETAIARFGYVRETNYGRVFDVRIKPVTINLADSDQGLEPHTDNPYRNPVPGLQILHALQTSGSGGGSVLIDGFNAVARLQAADPADFALLSQVPVTFSWSDGRTFLTTTAPIISLDHTGSCIGLKFNHRSFTGVNAASTQALEWRRAYRNLGSILEAENLRFTYDFKPGDMVIMDNQRILHGRESYDSQANARWLQGAYADKDAVISTLTSLTYKSVSTVIAEISTLFASDAGLQHYGEDVTLVDHMLQTAESLAAQGAADSLVIAGLLHDFGWLLGGEEGHHEIGADYLAQRLGPDVSEPIRLHVAAKRWLVAMRPDYYDSLSAESKRTYALQGGPMSPQECAEFEQNPWFQQAIKLRLADDQGKSIERKTRDFSDYISLIRRMAFHQVKAGWCGFSA